MRSKEELNFDRPPDLYGKILLSCGAQRINYSSPYHKREVLVLVAQRKKSCSGTVFPSVDHRHRRFFVVAGKLIP